jgi:hypothetical protein
VATAVPSVAERTANDSRAPVAGRDGRLGDDRARTASSRSVPTVPASAVVDAPHETELIEQDADLGAEQRALAASVDPSDVSPTTPIRTITPDVALDAGVQPIEVRRSTRARPARTDAPTPVPREATSSPTSAETDATQPAGATQETRALNDWRRLLFEATTEPTDRRSAPPRSAPPAKVAKDTAVRAPRQATQAPSNAPATAVPLLESTRRFLRPRVGIDPASVPVIQGPQVDRLLSQSGADAVAIGETIALPSTHDERSPRALGLLAHELTHVAQRRAPRFVPPVVRPPRAEAFPGQHESSHSMPSSEESLARHVERAVWRDADRRAAYGDDQTDDVIDASADDPADDRDSDQIHQRLVAPSHAARAHSHDSPWGRLPAPWEPMSTAHSSAGDAAAPASQAEAPAIHYAEHGRATHHDDASAAAAAAAHAAPPPDLDALARSVYDVLKRRLAAERRREG